MSSRFLQQAAILTALAATTIGAQVPVAQEFESLHFRSIGPAIMSGRISDFAVYEANPSIFYVGTAHGGVWKTTSNGALMTPVLQHDGLLSIGDVTVSQKNPDLIWVGKGEANNRQSTSWGDGVYKSTDGGKTWQMMGLANSKHIGRILIDPANDDIVLVAAGGPLFGPGGDRGVYKTTDGGRTWTRTLETDENTGVTDLARSATEPNVVYAATYQRRRSTCCMNGGGPGSGLYKSIDGGNTWTRIAGNGWPTGSLGRIGIDTYRKDGNIVYANVEGEGGGGGRGGRGGGGGTGGPDMTGVYRSADAGATWEKMSGGNPRPMYFSQMRIDPNNADHLFMGGVDLWMSTDGGRNFAQNAASTIHDDIHAIWIDPSNSMHMMIGGDGGIGISNDHSQTYRFLANLPVGLFYHVGYDMEQPYNVCGGMQDNYDWCGPSTSRNSGGIYNHEWFQVQGGDGFVAIPDQFDSRIVYSESQDGNMTRKNKVTGEGKSIRPSGANSTGLKPGEQLRFHWDTPFFLSPNDRRTLVVGANRVLRSTDRGDSWTAISPDLTSNASRDTIETMGLRGSEIRISRDDGVSQWPTIVSVAEHPKAVGVYYAGTDDGNLSMTRDGGKTWVNITSRLPGFPKNGFVSEIVPSKFDVSTVYVTVDNHRENDYTGHIWVSNDAGKTFRSITGALSGEVIKTLTEDQKNPNVLYVGAETGIFLSLDKGQTWRRFKANLPTVRVDEITLHPRDNAMIVATHGRAIWILDNLSPIQEYAAASAGAGEGKLFSIPDALQRKTKNDQNDGFWGHEFFVGENKPTDAVISYFVKTPFSDPLLRITDSAGRKVREIRIPQARNASGIQMVCWDQRTDPVPVAAVSGAGVPMGTTPVPGGRGGRGGGAGRGGAGGGNAPAFPPQAEPGYMAENPCGGGGGGFGGRGGGNPNAGFYVMPGKYNVALVSGGKVLDTKPITIIMDPAVKFTVAERTRYNAILADLQSMQEKGAPIASALSTMAPQIRAIDTALANRSDVPAAVKTQFAAVKRQFESIAPKFGVSTTAPTGNQGAGGGGRGGGRGGGPADTSTYGRLAGLKGQIGGIWETPSESLQRQYASLRLAMPRLLTDANAFMAAARGVSAELAKHSLTLTVPPR
jgi:photosystem II stability/assembly factor-like uncharacterized protein